MLVGHDGQKVMAAVEEALAALLTAACGGGSAERAGYLRVVLPLSTSGSRSGRRRVRGRMVPGR